MIKSILCWKQWYRYWHQWNYLCSHFGGFDCESLSGLYPNTFVEVHFCTEGWVSLTKGHSFASPMWTSILPLETLANYFTKPEITNSWSNPLPWFMSSNKNTECRLLKLMIPTHCTNNNVDNHTCFTGGTVYVIFRLLFAWNSASSKIKIYFTSAAILGMYINWQITRAWTHFKLEACILWIE